MSGWLKRLRNLEERVTLAFTLFGSLATFRRSVLERLDALEYEVSTLRECRSPEAKKEDCPSEEPTLSDVFRELRKTIDSMWDRVINLQEFRQAALGRLDGMDDRVSALEAEVSRLSGDKYSPAEADPSPEAKVAPSGKRDVLQERVTVVDPNYGHLFLLRKDFMEKVRALGFEIQDGR